MVSRLLFEFTAISESTFKLLGIGIMCNGGHIYVI